MTHMTRLCFILRTMCSFIEKIIMLLFIRSRFLYCKTPTSYKCISLLRTMNLSYLVADMYAKYTIAQGVCVKNPIQNTVSSLKEIFENCTAMHEGICFVLFCIEKCTENT